MKPFFFSSLILSTIACASFSFAAANSSAEQILKLNEWAQLLKKAPDAQLGELASAEVISAKAKRILSATPSTEIQALTEARLLFQADKFSEALELYEKIPRGSDHWLEAVEEKGWTYHRQKEYQKALAQTKTLLSLAFLPVIGSEPFFLQSLSQLKICDYKGILQTHQLYKESQRQRLLDMKSLSEKADPPALAKVIALAQSFPLHFTEIGEVAKSLPRLFYRDIAFQKSLMEYKMSQVALEQFRARAPGSAALIAALAKLQTRAEAAMNSRMKVLAQVESTENFKMVQKLNLIEVETIQRIHADMKMNPNSFSKGQFAQVDKDQMIFPDDGHPWVDELDKYQVKVNSCPQNIRRKM